VRDLFAEAADALELGMMNPAVLDQFSKQLDSN